MSGAGANARGAWCALAVGFLAGVGFCMMRASL
jgi:hypothetical protein